MSDQTREPAEGDPLAGAADTARLAPSIHNTQPWHWWVSGDALELYADRGRQLAALDPDGHLLAVSCGAALHHARVALAAQGYLAEVERFPDGPADDFLARLRLGPHTVPEESAVRLRQAILVRRTDRRPVPDRPVDPASIVALQRAAVGEGVNLEVLDPDQVIELAAAVSRAEAIEAVDPEQREELGRWVGGVRSDGLGLPDDVIPAEAPQTTVPEREFGRAGALPAGLGHDTVAVYAVLHGPTDTMEDWLRAGEALSAVWLTAIEHQLSLLPFSAPVEVLGTREVLRRLLADVGQPYLVVRLGAVDARRPEAPRTPRLPADEVIDRTS